MRNRLWIALAGLYAVGAIVTFGHAAAGNAKWRDINCATLDQRLKSPGTSCYGSPTGAAFPAAIGWPLYWSWEVWS